MEHLNRVELQGTVGAVRYNEVFGSGVANFSLATEHNYTNGTDTIVETTWFNVVAWSGKNIDDLSKVVKGCNVRVVGRFRTNKYTNIQGEEKVHYEVLAQELKVLKD